MSKTAEEIAAELDDLNVGDPEECHSLADDLLLEHAHPDVRAAYERLVARCRWWAFA